MNIAAALKNVPAILVQILYMGNSIEVKACLEKQHPSASSRIQYLFRRATPATRSSLPDGSKAHLRSQKLSLLAGCIEVQNVTLAGPG